MLGDTLRISNPMVIKLSGKKTSGLLSRVLAFGGAFFDPRSIFELVLRGQRSNFREIDKFSNLHQYISSDVYMYLHFHCFMSVFRHQTSHGKSAHT